MAGTKKGPWIAGTVVVAAAMAAGGWFGVISPTLDEATEVRDQAASQRDQNDLLQLQVAKLEADFAKLDEYKAQLATARSQIPATADLSSYLRQIDERAAADGVTITALAPGVPEIVTLATPAAGDTAATQPAAGDAGTPEPTPTETASPDATVEDPSDTATAAPTPTLDLGGLVAVPMSVTVVGSYPSAAQFLDDLQHATQRLLLVTSVTATALEESEATATRPATAPGDVELVVTGYTYVLPDADPLTAAGILDEGSLPSGTGRNPLLP